MNAQPHNTVGLLARRLQEKHEELIRYREDHHWRVFQGEAQDAYRADFDDSSWDPVDLPMAIDVRRGEVWLRCRIVVPREVASIDVSGSVMKLFSSVILDKMEVSVDSRKVLAADYWADLRGPRIVLDEKATPGTSHVVAVHLYPKYEPVSVPRIGVTLSHVERVAFELDSFAQELRIAKLVDEGLTESVCNAFDLEVLDGKPSVMMGEIDKARAKLSVLSEEAKKFRVHLVAHAHIDMNWLWPWRDTVDTIKDSFSTMVQLMDEYPDFSFSQSQAVTYKVVEDRFPELFEAIRRHVRNGDWDITASMWTEADLNMVGTEALVRQFLEAKRYVKDKFGSEPKVCWEPDTFGHIRTLPQVIRKTGGRYYYFMRCGKGHPIFWWESPDGSRVLAFTSVYNNFVTPKNVVDVALSLYERYGLRTSMFVYGVGNHGGGATIEDIEAARGIQKKMVLPEVVFSSTHDFFEEVEKELDGKHIPVINDELQFIFDGCYTSHADIKRYNRVCERLLVDAEKFSVLSGEYPRGAFRKAWLNTLFNQFHDILDGSGTGEAYDYPRELAEEAVGIADKALKASIRRLAERIKFSGPGTPIVVFNSLSWDRHDFVKAKVPRQLIPPNPVVVAGCSGEKGVAQVEGGEVIFVADVPSMGYRTYYLIEGSDRPDQPALSGGENTIENEYFKVDIDKSSGTIRSLCDKVEGRQVFEKHRYPYTMPVFSNLLQIMHELPHPMSAWVIGEISKTQNLMRDARVKLTEKGPVRATVEVVHEYGRSRITQYISLYRGLPRIDFHTVIDWKEVSDDKSEAPMLKVSFTPILGSSTATFEIPFGYVERAADGTEVPALRWVDLSDDKYGLSLLNDSKYGFDVKGNTIRMTLIRTSYSPDPKPDQGVHEIRYSLYPHRGSWKQALTFRRGYEANHPLEAYVVTEHPTAGELEGDEKSFLKVKPDNVVLSCLKLAEDSGDYIARVYDATGAGAEAELALSFKIKEASEVNMLEKEQESLVSQGSRVGVTLKPFEIKTIRIKAS